MGEDTRSDSEETGTVRDRGLTESGFGGLISSLVSAMRPVAPVAANLMWIVQPVAVLFDREAEVEALANWLADPDTEFESDAVWK